MRSKLTEAISIFLNKYWDGERPLLLGLSGGPDSMALLYLLLECRGLPIRIAHIDHGWRPESGEEAAQLTQLSATLEVPFFEMKLQPKTLHGNLEAACREERLNFFAKICKEQSCQAVLLAHHQGDQAETILKGLFEGAHRCTGMLPVTKMDGLEIWRPLLDIAKSVLLAWLEARGVVPFFDPTNLDRRFLRGKMRCDIVPELQKRFGKNIQPGLCAIGDEFRELETFLEMRLQHPLQAIESNPWGSFFDSRQFPNIDSIFEIKYMVRKCAERVECSLSSEILEKAAQHLKSRTANRHFNIGKYQIFVDRGCLFIRSTPFSLLPKQRVALADSFQYGNWAVEVVEVRGESNATRSTWKDVWNGAIDITLPDLNVAYEIGPPMMNSRYRDISSLNKWCNNHKVPAFLRKVAPVIWSDDVVVHEFLTGRSKSEEKGLRIRLAQKQV